MSNRYAYTELRAAAIAEPNAENLAALGEWFDNYGMDSWNGEYYDADGYQLRPIYEEVAEDEFERIGWELH